MIAFIRGALVEALPSVVVVDVGGVGYEALIPLSSFDKLPELGEQVHLLTHLAVREDAHTLYAFMSEGEREIFRLLVGAVSGIGPKIALNVLSGMSVDSFRASVAAGDDKSLAKISGIGKKTAQRIVVELKDKIGKTVAAAAKSGEAGAATVVGEQKLNDAVMALAALGFKAGDATESVKAAQAMLGPDAAVEDLVRAALKK
jgi:Holliday junction DNA helicase RuvA